jgi:hypothetical protein
MSTDYPGLPDQVIVTLADDDGHRARVYRLADMRGYTHRYDTIRVHDGGRTDQYAVDILRGEGWTRLCIGNRADQWSMPYAEAVLRAVAILFGMDAHG